jgi:hypothetical protein
MEELVNQTIGKGRRVTLMFNQPLRATAIDGLAVSEDARSATCSIVDVAADLPPLLERCARAQPGVRVEDVQIDRPTLHNVFIALTGRELRE